jgi:predicted transcriptional regulator
VPPGPASLYDGHDHHGPSLQEGAARPRKQGRAFVYSARVTRRQLVLDAGAGLIRGLLDSEGEPALSFLVDAVTDSDRQLLDRLESLVREKKRQAKGR